MRDKCRHFEASRKILNQTERLLGRNREIQTDGDRERQTDGDREI